VGSGPHLCFLHGFCENSSIWQGLISHLSEKYTCLAIDLPGFGESSSTPFDSLHQIATQVNEILMQEKATETIMLGHSMGGYILADYIEYFGEQLRGVAFVHSTALADPPEKRANRLKTIDFIKQHGPSEFFRLFVPGLVAVQNLSRLREQMTNMVTATKTISIIAGLSAMGGRTSKVAVVEKFNKPILWLVGEEDLHYTHQEIYGQAAKCSLAQINVIHGVGHLSMLENPETCIAEVERFLAIVEISSPTS
jgi:pimeloyl-ACP methyl ester carboxylesterase